MVCGVLGFFPVYMGGKKNNLIFGRTELEEQNLRPKSCKVSGGFRYFQKVSLLIRSKQ